ncbi:MAG: acetylglutamate kinase [Deltaproteobacteria bacterium]|jgi:acetylglutamate kinase|nr:acetylglutamate kinase [SAR324 cluster bacterium]
MKISHQDKKDLLIEALSYIQRFRNQIIVIKYGGAAMIEEALKTSFAQDIVLLQSLGMQPVVVHGGGPEVSKVIQSLGQEVTFVDGLRVTTAENLKVAEMVLSGNLNKEIIAHLQTFGGKAVGLSGKDGNLIQADKKKHASGIDLGYVGTIRQINPELLHLLMREQFIPVVSPIGMGSSGETYNINADTVAAAIAVALEARKVIFMTDVDGVLSDGKELISYLDTATAENLITNKVISGGMVPKIQAALDCVKANVRSAHIINGTDPHSVIAELFTDQGIGTQIVRAE